MHHPAIISTAEPTDAVAHPGGNSPRDGEVSAVMSIPIQVN
jgi:hypothetical protein